ncbi:beta-ketoacyl-ACP synthase III [Burkholderia singularis]|nr:beta-ketoacyl-ACP synthase III [Burkholderia singularis]
MSLRPAYITRVSSFMPGNPIDNDHIEKVLGYIGGQPSRARPIILRNNGIKQRHYVLDAESGLPQYSNADITVKAIKGLCDDRFSIDEIECLSTGTTLPDQLMPNHGVMVHGQLGMPACEVVATSGICVAGMTALKYGYLSVTSGNTCNAVTAASEVLSVHLHARNFEKENETLLDELHRRPEIAFEKEFLRWMLSDGAGAVLIENQPRKNSLSLKIDWIDIFSYAHVLPTCMYAGAEKNDEGNMVGWRNFSPEEQASRSIFAIKQDVRLLNENVVSHTLSKPLRTVIAKRGLFAKNIDWFLPHMSSEYFRKPIFQALDEIGLPIPEKNWFTNLTTKGNTGAASIYIMLDDLLKRGNLASGQRILCFVPESGRFSSAFMHLTVTEE